MTDEEKIVRLAKTFKIKGEVKVTPCRGDGRSLGEKGDFLAEIGGNRNIGRTKKAAVRNLLKTMVYSVQMNIASEQREIDDCKRTVLFFQRDIARKAKALVECGIDPQSEPQPG